jgi:uncharacterized protein (TIGR03435 family)
VQTRRPQRAEDNRRIRLSYFPSDPVFSEPAPTLLAAQLGLRLDKSKTPLDVIVIDHMDKEPTEN